MPIRYGRKGTEDAAKITKEGVKPGGGWGGIVLRTEKGETESPEILVLGASFGGSKKVTARGTGSCDPGGHM